MEVVVHPEIPHNTGRAGLASTVRLATRTALVSAGVPLLESLGDPVAHEPAPAHARPVERVRRTTAT